MAIVGAGVVVAVTLPFAASAPTMTAHTWDSQVGPDTWRTYDVPADAAHSAAVRFTWNASRAAEVYWYAAGPCASGTGWCLEGVLANWSGTTSGNWTAIGVAATGYCILVDDSGSASMNFTGQFVESVSNPGHRLPMVPLAFGLGGGAILIGMGGVATYLGLFLPASVYRSESTTPGDDDDPDDLPDPSWDDGRSG